ncbi:8470_t:CDS:2 [Paraglomus occultum]|uniref:8470_t:CDS:1 n=1 Tax=Paraglomus occultum TaxID=144539 RepID=A0A9N9AI45_9GLOM|nr:8470_t:CDS:2 [Paraglomus occultum]
MWVPIYIYDASWNLVSHFPTKKDAANFLKPGSRKLSAVLIDSPRLYKNKYYIRTKPHTGTPDAPIDATTQNDPGLDKEQNTQPIEPLPSESSSITDDKDQNKLGDDPDSPSSELLEAINMFAFDHYQERDMQEILGRMDGPALHTMGVLIQEQLCQLIQPE